jgi:hypothetical protein
MPLPPAGIYEVDLMDIGSDGVFWLPEHLCGLDGTLFLVLAGCGWASCDFRTGNMASWPSLLFIEVHV